MSTEHGLDLMLVRPPFPMQPIKAETEPMQLVGPEEFELYRELAEDSDSPILVSPREFYQLLEAVLVRALDLIPDIRMSIIKVNMPGGLRLPERLIAADVFLAQNVDAVYADCIARKIHSLCIKHGLRRFPFEGGRNTFRLRFSTGGDGPLAVRLLAESLAPLGLVAIAPAADGVP